MAAGIPTGVRVKRDKNRLYFVDGSGQVRSVPRRTGGKAGRRSCWPRKSPATGRKIAHPRFGTEGRRSYSGGGGGGRKSGGRKSGGHKKSGHHKTARKTEHKRPYRITGAAARSYVTARSNAFARFGHRRTSKRTSKRR